jgi:pimeloyl-ACP methyl ester carboxylesterase
LCHGIGEVVERWFPVQQLLAANGGASLVFDYSGYGRSTGSISWTQCETDTVAAFEYLRGLAPGYPLSVLGFSLGSGVAAAAMDRIRPHMLVLCAAFTSFRAAAHSLGLPRKIAPVIPDIWKAAETLRECRIPVLVVHGERDALFPVRMAEELAKLCGPCAELLIVPRLGHNEPFYKPRMAYWGLILSRLAAQQKAAVSAARL